MVSLNIPSASADNPAGVLEKAIILSISLSRFGLKQTVSSEDETIQIKAPHVHTEGDEDHTTIDRDLVHITKDILDAPELRKIVNHDRRIIDYIRSRSVPCPILKNGMYMLMIDKVEELEEGLQPLLDERIQLIEQACEVYPERVEDIEKRLGPLFDPGDYPDAGTVKAAYAVKTSYVSFSVPWKLERMSQSLYNREKEKAAEAWATVLEQAEQLLCTELSQLVNAMVEVLTPAEDGKEKTVRKPFLEKFANFFNNFSGRNVSSKAELNAIVEQGRALLSGLDSSAFKGNGEIRDHVRSGFTQIKENLDNMITQKPERRIILRKPASGE